MELSEIALVKEYPVRRNREKERVTQKYSHVANEMYFKNLENGFCSFDFNIWKESTRYSCRLKSSESKCECLITNCNICEATNCDNFCTINLPNNIEINNNYSNRHCLSEIFNFIRNLNVCAFIKILFCLSYLLSNIRKSLHCFQSAKDVLSYTNISVSIKCSSVNLCRHISTTTFLMFILLSVATSESCVTNCSCSVLSNNIASENWASLIPSSPPQHEQPSQTSIHSKDLSILFESNMLSNLTEHKSLFPPLMVNDTIGDIRTKRKANKHQEDTFIHDNIIEMTSSEPSVIQELASKSENKNNTATDQEKNRFLNTQKNISLYSLMNNPYIRHLLLNRKRKKHPGIVGIAQNVEQHQDTQESSYSSVPEIIQEQIPDTFYGERNSLNPNMQEEIHWLFNDSTIDDIITSEEEEHYSPDETEHHRLSMNCAKNGFFRVPKVDDVDAGFNFTDIVRLNLSYNNITNLTASALNSYSRLRYLSLRHNYLHSLHSESLSSLQLLHTLDLSENLLTAVPDAVLTCPHLTVLLLADNDISYVSASSFSGLSELQWVDLRNNPLRSIHSDAFQGLPALKKLILKETREMFVFPNLSSSRNLEVLGIDRAALTSVPDSLCYAHPKLRSLNLHLNQLKHIPHLSGCDQLKLLDLSNNHISELREGSFEGTRSLQDLLLQHNYIQIIPDEAFKGLQHLQVLNLEHNRISFISPSAFLPLHTIEDLNLGNNVFSELPSKGLEHVLYLKVHNNRHLRQFPGPQSFPSVLDLVLSYAYHCCPFLGLVGADDHQSSATHPTDSTGDSTYIQERVVFNIDGLQRHDPRIWNDSQHIWPYYPMNPGTNFTALWVNLDSHFPAASTPTTSRTSEAGISSSTPLPAAGGVTAAPSAGGGGLAGPSRLVPGLHNQLNLRLKHEVVCIPQPGPFMPCRDLFDWWTLRCGVWLVFLLALMGNGVVVVVLVAAYAKMDVPRFLVTNLALADFLMGVYLGFLAVVDASTLGEFRMYAIPWQMSAGCQLAGFLGVLSSELSVYTLTVITLERNYAIIHAMNLNKRLSLRHAAYIMAVGWIFALTMAILPLAGVSDYRKFAVCLPFETDGAGLGYVVFLMVINGVAFMILMGCYLKIYCAIRGSQAWNSNDSRIAKRMALLVFTDFICWAPIAFFSLSAAYGLQLISLEEAKVFTVFVLPLNSCCNPFLYALLTKQFKKDCVMLCKAIEESRVTRGIGRCRHSSNFSNRQTPANTNSALDSKSRETCSCGATEKRRARQTQIINFLCCRRTHLRDGTYSKSHRRNLSPKKELTVETKNMSSWTWRGGWRSDQKPGPLRLLDLRRPASLDLTRKSSQESSLSSSRHDSSSASTATWRVSRSSVSSDASKTDSSSRPGSQKDDTRASTRHSSKGGTKPRLQRQRAIEKDTLGTSRLNCPVHHKEELSCVYEQASIEEAAEIKLNPSPRFCHRRSLSDGLLFCTLTATQPYADVKPSPAALLVRSPTILPTSKNEKDLQHTESVSVDYDSSSKPGLLETHFPLEDEEETVPKEVSPLL